MRRMTGITHSKLIIVQVAGTWGRRQCYGNPELPGQRTGEREREARGRGGEIISVIWP